MSRSRNATRPPVAAPSHTLLASSIAAALALGLHASAASAADSSELKEVTVTTGSRGKAVTVTDSPSPIDVISGEQIRATGKASLREILGTIAPSYTAPSQPGGGTSASIRPAKIRGLSGDLLLVLVNGKRRHNSAVYNNFGTGSVPTDLDLIPVSAIERIELLRDGAAAQYGSDAIAGVLNIILKRSSSGTSAATTVGQQSDKPGDLFQQSFFHARELGQDGGFINFAVDVRLQGPSYSAGDAQGLLYFPTVNGAQVKPKTAGATPDPREATADRLLSKGTGRSNRDKVISTSYNAELPVSEQLTLYSFGTISHRDVVDSRGSYRPNSVSSRPEAFPDGFTAQRLISQPDYQLTAGGKGLLSDWNYDLSTTWSTDFAMLRAQNTINASLPDVSQRNFYLGSLKFQQLTTNLDLTREIDVGLPKPAQLSWGLEHRYERYVEAEGEPASYIDGGYVYPSGPWAGSRPPAGLQSFVGNAASDAGSASRNSVAGYLDLGANITKEWFLSGAARYEHYSDSSGNAAAGKLATRYEIAPGLGIRGTVNNGFRAPSLAQQIFSVTQSTGTRQANSTVSYLSAYLPPESAAAKALGAKPLKPEKSQNVSFGVTWEASRDAKLTVDFYRIKIRDMIIKGESVRDTGTSVLVRNRLAALGYPNLSAAQYNLNAATTRTQGIDIASELNQGYGGWGTVKWTALYSYNKTKLLQVAPNPPELAFLGGGTTYKVFGYQAQHQLTDSTPKYKLVLGGNWKLHPFTTNLRLTRYGSYVEPATDPAGNLKFGPKWITDLDVAYQFNKQLSVALGAINLFAVRPDKQKPAITSDTSFPGDGRIDASNNYGSFSPFGSTGGFYYARLTYDF